METSKSSAPDAHFFTVHPELGRVLLLHPDHDNDAVKCFRELVASVLGNCVLLPALRPSPRCGKGVPMTKRIVIWKVCLSEAASTFVLVFAGTGAIVINDVAGGVITHWGIAMTFGLAVMIVVYVLGVFLGAHINPAVTIGLWFAGRFPRERVLPYVVSQIAGAVLASTLLRLLVPDHGQLGMTVPAGSVVQSVVVEMLLTFVLMLVIMVIVVGANEKSLRAGVAIGMTVRIGALYAGPISGGSMSPARSLGPAIVTSRFADQWIYVVAPLLGAVLAVVVYQGVHGALKQDRSFVHRQSRSAIQDDGDVTRRS